MLFLGVMKVGMKLFCALGSCSINEIDDKGAELMLVYFVQGLDRLNEGVFCLKERRVACVLGRMF
ncbi:MAG: hypothetical protein DRN04_00530 [Thermoprotei archaeon]|nr:MAG: hypothetical protein DRN04_00530 [Thermoprotei archaeon]